MLTARRAILGLALLLAMTGDSAGQSPPESPRQNPSGAQQRTATEQSDTDQAPPSIIKALPAPQAQEKPNTNGAKGPENWNDALGLSDKIAVIASIVAFLQFLALFSTVWVMIRNGRRQLRAYLAIEHAKRQGDHDFGPQFRFNLSFKNCGQTPAYKGTYWANVQAKEFPLTSDLVPSDLKSIGRFEAPPTNIFNIEQFSDEIADISADRATEFTNRKIAFYIFGQVDFVDAFGKSRWLKFRFRYGAECVTSGRLAIEEIKSN